MHTIRRGFTVIELLVVIAIIGILSVLALVTYSRAQANSRDGRRKTDVSAYLGSFESYRLAKGSYVVPGVGAKSSSYGRLNFKGGQDGGVAYGTTSTIAEKLKQEGYLSTIAKDPRANGSSDTKAGAPDYVVVRCDIKGVQAVTAADGDLIGVWTKLESAASNDVDAGNAAGYCGVGGQFASSSMAAPAGITAIKDGKYFAAGNGKKQ